MRNGFHNKSFTLVEMLIVIVIIGLLSVVLIPKILGAQERARDTRRIADVRQIGQGLQSYVYTNNTIPSSAGTGYKDISSISGALLEHLKSIPDDKGRGLMVNAAGDFISSGDNYAYYVDGDKAIVTATMEGGKGNTPTCNGLVSSKNVFDRHSDGYNIDIGNIDRAIKLNGIDEYISLKATGTGYLSKNTYTISIWAKPDFDSLPISGRGSTVFWDNETQFNIKSNGFFARHWSRDNIQTIINKSNVYPFCKKNERCHLSMKMDGSILSFYINGTNVGTIAAAGLSRSTTTPLLGKDESGFYYKGSLYGFRIYDRALSDNEIQQLANHIDVTGELIGHYPLNETEGDIVYEQSGTAKKGNIFNKDASEDPDYILIK